MSQGTEGNGKHSTVGDEDKGQEGLRSVSSSVTEIIWLGKDIFCLVVPICQTGAIAIIM